MLCLPLVFLIYQDVSLYFPLETGFNCYLLYWLFILYAAITHCLIGNVGNRNDDSNTNKDNTWVQVLFGKNRQNRNDNKICKPLFFPFSLIKYQSGILCTELVCTLNKATRQLKSM